MDRLELATDRDSVVLRQLTLVDAGAYFEAVDASRKHLDEFSRETSTNYPDYKSVVDSIVNPIDPNKLRMGIWDVSTFVGSINLRPQKRGDAEMGYWIDERHTRRGYATLAARALAKYANPSYSEVYARVDIHNKASAGVLEKAGFERRATALGKFLYVYVEQ